MATTRFAHTLVISLGAKGTPEPDIRKAVKAAFKSGTPKHPRVRE